MRPVLHQLIKHFLKIEYVSFAAISHSGQRPPFPIPARGRLFPFRPDAGCQDEKTATRVPARSRHRDMRPPWAVHRGRLGGGDMDREGRRGHHAGMRYIPLIPLLFLAACDAGPAAFGITGTAPSPPPPDPGALSTDAPGAAPTGTSYGPTIGPSTGSGRFWGYN